MNLERLLRKIVEWYPCGRRRRIIERPQNMWIQEVATKMREKGINSKEWIGQGRMGKQNEINTLGTEICEIFDMLYKNILLTNTLAYGTRVLNDAFSRTLQ